MFQLLASITREHLAEGVVAARQAGLGIELQTYTYAGQLDDWQKQLALERELLADFPNPLTMHAMMLEPELDSLDDPDSAYNKAYTRNIELAGELGAKILVVHPFRHQLLKPHRYEETAGYRDWQVEFFGGLLPQLEKTGVKLAIENLCETGPRVMSEVLDRLASPLVGACMDVGHANIFSEVPLTEWLPGLGAHLCYLHLHNNHVEQDEHLSLGEGTVDFHEFLTALAAHKPPPWLSIEARNKETAVRSLEFLQKEFR